MAQTTLSIRIDEGVKNQFEQLCNEIGLTISAAINLFAKTVIRQREIPFKLSAKKPSFVVDSQEELDESLERALAEYKEGKGTPAKEVFAKLERKYGICLNGK